MTGRFSVALAIATAVWLGGCGGTASSQDAGCKKSADPTQCAWTPCTNSVAEACASKSLHCLMTWPSDVTAFCSARPAGVPPGVPWASASLNCGNYYVFSESDVETSTSFYYSAQTGQLVAIVDGNGQWQTARCRGGPSDFVEPTCSTHKYFTCPDAGP